MKTDPIVFGFEEILDDILKKKPRPQGIQILGKAHKYVYCDYKVSSGEIFYLGKGGEKRLYQKDKRGPVHKKIVQRHGLRRVAFAVGDNETARRIEDQLIEIVGRRKLGTGGLINKQGRGFPRSPAPRPPRPAEWLASLMGVESTDPELHWRLSQLLSIEPPVEFSNKALTEILRVRRSSFHYGKEAFTQWDWPQWFVAEVQESQREWVAMGGPKKERHVEEDSEWGSKEEEEARALLPEPCPGGRNPMFGKTHSEETKARLSESRRGLGNPMYGRTHSEEAKAKLAAANSLRKQIADELGMAYHSVTKSVIAGYKERNK